MVETLYIPDLKRFTFFAGQLLSARDLTELQRFHQELRWLHQRGLHGWGIAAGFSVTGDKGESAVTVEPGFGLDCLGREILLTEPIQKAVPAVAGGPQGTAATYYLVAAYQEDADQKVADRRTGICLPGGTVRLANDPRLEWREASQLQEGYELILAQIWVKDCQLSRPVSLTVRRYAHAWQRPYIAAGQTRIGDTIWKTIPDLNISTIAVMTEVDTSQANFQATPCYSAHVVGDRALPNPMGVPVVYQGITVVAQPGPHSFILQFFFQPVADAPDEVSPEQLRQQWYVVWMGVEG